MIAAVVAVAAYYLRSFRSGRELYAIGSNPDAARLAGIPIATRVFTAFVISGALAGIAGVLWAARYGTIDSTAGTGYELNVVAAVVVGGVAIFGGSGTVVGAALGALLLNTINDAALRPRHLVVLGPGDRGAAADRRDRARPRDHAAADRGAAPEVAPWSLSCRPCRAARDAASRGCSPLRPLGVGARARRDRRRVVLGVLSSSQFLTSGNLFYLCISVGEVAIMTLPLTFIVITGEIDLSVASTLGLSSALVGYLWSHGWPMSAIIPTVLVVGVVTGAFNGLLVTRVGLPVARGDDRHADPLPRDRRDHPRPEHDLELPGHVHEHRHQPGSAHRSSRTRS